MKCRQLFFTVLSDFFWWNLLFDIEKGIICRIIAIVTVTSTLNKKFYLCEIREMARTQIRYSQNKHYTQIRVSHTRYDTYVSNTIQYIKNMNGKID